MNRNTTNRTWWAAVFGQNLRAARLKSGLTQLKLARAAGIDRPSLTTYEAGGVIPSVMVAARLADALGVGLADLLPINDVHWVNAIGRL